MKLLFDQNLPPQMVDVLAGLFPGSAHVYHLELHEAPDDVIWVALGNCSSREIEEILRSNTAAIRAFEADPEEAYLILR